MFSPHCKAETRFYALPAACREKNAANNLAQQVHMRASVLQTMLSQGNGMLGIIPSDSALIRQMEQ